MRDVQGLLFNIQYFCMHDGPGIRTTVFLKGCPLGCIWCHNPEGISPKRQLSFVESRCVRCGACAKLSPDELLDSSAACCPAKALTVVGYNITAEELLAQLLRDRRYYDTSGGGVTFSGGEPTMQRAFLSAMLRLTAQEGVFMALETCGFCDFAYYQSILPYVELFLYDYKESDPAKHKACTGMDNSLILENLERLHDAGAKIILRCPIIPGCNDRDDHFENIARVTHKYPKLLGAELLPYHGLAASKAGRMGLEAQEEYPRPSPATVEKWKERVRAAGGRIL